MPVQLLQLQQLKLHYWRQDGHARREQEESMEFGYFTLSDNHYENNPRDANQFVQDIAAEALYADQLGMHSAWIGEHHFNSLGVLSCPDLVLAYIASRTKHIRLAPAVTVTPLHNPIRVAEQWATLDLLSGGRVDFAAGRGYDAREYAPFHVDFKNNQGIFEESIEVIQNLWTAKDRISHHGTHYQFDDVRITPKPLQKPVPIYIGSFSKPSIELAARLGCGLIVAPFAAAMSYGGLKQVADLYHETCAKHGKKPQRLMCSYFTHFYDNPQQEAAQRARQIRYYKECVIPALPGDPKTAPPSYTYFIDMVARLHKVEPHMLTDNSVLLGNAQAITDSLKKVEAAGFNEVILYFNVGMKPHNQVKEEMDRFMREVAPNFQGKHLQRRAA
jgi:alkanesulfonate monooxygenase SsuD/methylene tetrahydromethanopterin reductase-like flavin-dependent oxidoreductase (luciferase family)